MDYGGYSSFTTVARTGKALAKLLLIETVVKYHLGTKINKQSLSVQMFKCIRRWACYSHFSADFSPRGLEQILASH